jgi:transcriptional regulator with XRE-family HTH domain
MYSRAPLVDSRGAAYARLASRVLEALNEAVQRRLGDGVTRSDIADRLGCHRSQLSRVLNGTVPNLTLRTIADILWATDHEADDFRADPVEVV